MKKRIVSLLLCLVLCAALLPSFAAAEGEWSEYLWICNTQVTHENANDVLEDGGTVSYDHVAHTLTLNGAKLSITEQPAIRISREAGEEFDHRLTINLIGENTITVKDASAAISNARGFKGLTFSGDGSLTIKCTGAGDTGDVYGIKLNSGSYSAPSDEQPALMIDGVTLEITTGEMQSKDRFWCGNYGIYLSGERGADLCIQKGAQVTVTTGAAKKNVDEGNVNYGILARRISVDGANTKLTATAGEAEGKESGSYGIYIKPNYDENSGTMVVTGGASVTATGGEAATSYGVYLRDEFSITVEDASLLAKTVQDAGENVSALNKAPDLKFTSGYDWRTAASDKFTPSTTTLYSYDSKQTYVEVKPTEPEEDPETPDEQPDGVGGLVAILDDVPFVDVDFNDYYYDSVKWAYHSGVTGGTDAWHFSPDAGCTRAEAVTFLWRAAGCPTVSYLGNFTDVDADAYYAPAVAWAVANGVTNGTSATTFSPDAACSRGDIVTFLFRAFGGTSNGYHPFGDVPANAYYADAVAWAYEHNVTGGTSSTTFSPADACSRAQIVTFLYRVLG